MSLRVNQIVVGNADYDEQSDERRTQKKYSPCAACGWKQIQSTFESSSATPESSERRMQRGFGLICLFPL